jgi:hypothetical protein
MCDWIGWTIGIVGIVIAIIGIYIGVNGNRNAARVEQREKERRGIAHTALVNLKPAIQGDNKAAIIDAINDTLEKLKD